MIDKKTHGSCLEWYAKNSLQILTTNCGRSKSESIMATDVIDANKDDVMHIARHNIAHDQDQD